MKDHDYEWLRRWVLAEDEYRNALHHLGRAHDDVLRAHGLGNVICDPAVSRLVAELRAVLKERLAETLRSQELLRARCGQ